MAIRKPLASSGCLTMLLSGSLIFAGASRGLAQVQAEPIAEERPKEAVAPAFATAVRHPLDPLDFEEIGLATRAIRADGRFAATFRFVSVALQEPSKQSVLHGH